MTTRPAPAPRTKSADSPRAASRSGRPAAIASNNLVGSAPSKIGKSRSRTAAASADRTAGDLVAGDRADQADVVGSQLAHQLRETIAVGAVAGDRRLHDFRPREL